MACIGFFLYKHLKSKFIFLLAFNGHQFTSFCLANLSGLFPSFSFWKEAVKFETNLEPSIRKSCSGNIKKQNMLRSLRKVKGLRTYSYTDLM